MTIRPGESWGVTGTRPNGVLEAATDREASRLLESLEPDTTPTIIAVASGDAPRTAGGEHRRRSDNDVALLPWDLMDLELDGRRVRALSHVVFRRRFWRGEVVALMNVDHLRHWDVAPRAHPNDGLIDIVDVTPDMSMRERLEARRRLVTGTHIPHPRIRVARRHEWEREFTPAIRCYVDGVYEGRVHRVQARVIPDAVILCL